jgi:exopolysaccharide biosynthesis protein
MNNKTAGAAKERKCILKLRLIFLASLILLTADYTDGQLKWANVDSIYQPLPPSVHVYYTNSKIDTANFRAFYLVADLKDKKLDFTADTTRDRRITPQQFYNKNDKPLAVVNCTFFSYETNRSLNVVVKDSKLVAYNQHSIAGKGKDTMQYIHFFRSAIGISKKREADIVWLYTDSADKFAHQYPFPMPYFRDSFNFLKRWKPFTDSILVGGKLTEAYVVPNFPNWKVQTSVGGGPVLLQEGEIKITNEEEMMFTGKAINDKHPRTAMGYTKDNRLIILVVEGRNPGIAEGATLTQEAQILKDLGCWEALNLDGGGSSCLLINGKETIKVSDKMGQRPVPAVFLIREK